MLCLDFVSYQRTQTIPALDQSDQSCYDDGYVCTIVLNAVPITLKI